MTKSSLTIGDIMDFFIKITKIFVSHCFSTRYPLFGVNLEVKHKSKLLCEKLPESVPALRL